MKWTAPFSRLLIALMLCCNVQPSEAAQVVARRIVSLAPNITELAFAAGAGDRLVGVDEYSDFPAAARALPRVGNAFRVDFERVLALRPDVVLAWSGGTSPGVVERLRELQMTVKLVSTQRLADVSQALRQIGAIAGTSGTAEPAAREFERKIAGLREQYAGRQVLSVFLQVDHQPLYTVNGEQIMSEIVELCGGRNVFADLDKFAPEVGIEAVIAANPQVIVATENRDAADVIEQWRRWPHIAAVKNGNVYNLPPDDVTRAAPRLVHGAEALCRTIETARRSTPRVQLKSNP